MNIINELEDCPHCRNLNDDFFETDDHERGCSICIERCDNCDARVFRDELHEAYLLKNNRWVKSNICDNCWQCYNEDPAFYDNISEEDPMKVIWDNLQP